MIQSSKIQTHGKGLEIISDDTPRHSTSLKTLSLIALIKRRTLKIFLHKQDKSVSQSQARHNGKEINKFH